MKVLLLSKSARTGGAAIASYRLMEALKKQGVDAEMLVQEDGGNEIAVHSTTQTVFKRWVNFLRFVLERLAFLPYERNREIRFLFSLANTGEDITRKREVEEADIIHLHWINAGFLSLRSLKRLLKLGKPIVWTFHDMWPLTGGCHYALDCKGYTGHCGHCPYLKKPGSSDLSHRLWKKKDRLFRDRRINIITPSHWLGDCVRESSMLAHGQLTTIHNPIDHGIFKPVKREDACGRLELDPSKKYILFGAANLRSMLKGFEYFQEAMEIIAARKKIAAGVEILLFGKSGSEVASSLHLPANEFAFINSTQTMIDLYNAACLFVLPSMQDNLPNTVLESMFCGTPVVGFNTGGIPEMIHHQVNGYLAEHKSAADLAEGISWGLTADWQGSLSEKTRAMALERFSEEHSVERHLELYEKMVNNVSV